MTVDELLPHAYSAPKSRSPSERVQRVDTDLNMARLGARNSARLGLPYVCDNACQRYDWVGRACPCGAITQARTWCRWCSCEESCGCDALPGAPHECAVILQPRVRSDKQRNLRFVKERLVV